MSRLEAAIESAREDMEHPFSWAPRRIATRTLAAADAYDAAHGIARIDASDEAVERAAKHIAGLPVDDDWPFTYTLPDTLAADTCKRDRYRETARAVIEALRGTQP